MPSRYGSVLHTPLMRAATGKREMESVAADQLMRGTEPTTETIMHELLTRRSNKGLVDPFITPDLPLQAIGGAGVIKSALKIPYLKKLLALRPDSLRFSDFKDLLHARDASNLYKSINLPDGPNRAELDWLVSDDTYAEISKKLKHLQDRKNLKVKGQQARDQIKIDREYDDWFYKVSRIQKAERTANDLLKQRIKSDYKD